jgi:hypothetical protein
LVVQFFASALTWVLGDELAGDGEVKDGFFEAFYAARYMYVFV